MTSLPPAIPPSTDLRPDDELTVVVTGGAGFIGSNLVRRMLATTRWTVVNADALTYAGNLDSLADVASDARYHFEQVDIRDGDAMRALFTRWTPDAVMHLAAESHVDRSIDGPGEFLQTNVIGTYTLLDAALRHWRALPPDAAARFRFLHVSTDEVFGSLALESAARFDESTRYDPSSPYSASKAASDHLVNAWMHTYGLPCVTTNCSNNYGPYQFPEKLIPLMILRALRGESLPVYGQGENIRDWLHVHDHADALLAVLARGRVGETYCIGGDAERQNLDVVHAICAIVDELAPDAAIGPRSALVEFVADRPGHDLRYAIDSGKVQHELGWRPRHSFEDGLRETVLWYLHNQPWCDRVSSGAYRQQRLGLLHPA